MSHTLSIRNGIKSHQFGKDIYIKNNPMKILNPIPAGRSYHNTLMGHALNNHSDSIHDCITITARSYRRNVMSIVFKLWVRFTCDSVTGRNKRCTYFARSRIRHNTLLYMMKVLSAWKEHTLLSKYDKCKMMLEIQEEEIGVLEAQHATLLAAKDQSTSMLERANTCVLQRDKTMRILEGCIQAKDKEIVEERSKTVDCEIQCRIDDIRLSSMTSPMMGSPCLRASMTNMKDMILFTSQTPDICLMFGSISRGNGYQDIDFILTCDARNILTSWTRLLANRSGCAFDEGIYNTDLYVCIMRYLHVVSMNTAASEIATNSVENNHRHGEQMIDARTDDSTRESKTTLSSYVCANSIDIEAPSDLTTDTVNGNDDTSCLKSHRIKSVATALKYKMHKKKRDKSKVKKHVTQSLMNANNSHIEASKHIRRKVRITPTLRTEQQIVDYILSTHIHGAKLATLCGDVLHLDSKNEAVHLVLMSLLLMSDARLTVCVNTTDISKKVKDIESALTRLSTTESLAIHAREKCANKCTSVSEYYLGIYETWMQDYRKVMDELHSVQSQVNVMYTTAVKYREEYAAITSVLRDEMVYAVSTLSRRCIESRIQGETAKAMTDLQEQLLGSKRQTQALTAALKESQDAVKRRNVSLVELGSKSLNISDLTLGTTQYIS